MPVKIRLARRGRKKHAMYDVVVADSRAPRDGRFIEKLGTYNPNTPVADIKIDNDRAFHWLMRGAQPTDTVRAMLSYRGLMLKKHLQFGVIKGALKQEEADKKFEDWVSTKDAAIQSKAEKLASEKEKERKARLEAEAKVKEAREEALKQKAAAEAAENAPAEEEAEAAEQPANEAAVEEAPKEEKAEEAPKEEKSEEAPKAEKSEEAPKEEAEAKDDSEDKKEA